MAGPQHREIGTPISTSNASWGAGPQQREIGTTISTGNASWRGPNKEKLEPQFQQAMQVGEGQQI
ncbi:TPA: hypothetical protein ACSTOR_000259 [Staphylococcus aureus]